MNRPAPTDRELLRRAEKSLLPPEDVDPRDLDREVHGELRSLSKETADVVARHLIAAGRLLDADPEQALAHAYAARAHAARIGVVREAVGIAAYLAGEWQVAISELRAARRMSGSEAHLPLLADCERALGRPDKALELARSKEAQTLDLGGRMELLLVAAGARRDLGQLDAALLMLQVPELNFSVAESWLPRLRYAYAEALLESGDDEQARHWFVMAAEADHDDETDAGERVLEMDGVVLQEAEPEGADEDGEAGDAAGIDLAQDPDDAAAGADDAGHDLEEEASE